MPLSIARKRELKLRVELDCLLLTWTFLAGIVKEMDQDDITQAYVTAMKEDISLFRNELVWFQRYFSTAYAIFIVPSLLVQTKVFTPMAENR